MEKHDDAVIELKKALEMDPLSLLANYILGMLLFLADRYDEAINQLLHTLDLGLFPNAYVWLGGSYLFSGNYKKAIEAYNMYVTLTGKNPASLGYLGYAYCITGQKDKALEILNILDELPKPDYDPTYAKALMSAGMGEIDRTFIYVDDLVQKKNPTVVWIKVLPQFDILHADPRYKALCEKMGFPE